MKTMKGPTRNPKRARPVLIHPELHQLLARVSREEGYTMQDRLHLILCDHFGRPDLSAEQAVPAVAS